MMMISQAELRFNFQGAQFDLASNTDCRFLGWIFNQFLYGEVTGIQCGHWLYRAPNLTAASFLAKQATEELSHVRRISRILSLLGEKPEKAHWAIRFLATGMMGSSWGEHVGLEMALGEGLVLGVFYAMADLIPDPEIERILRTAAIEEERHVEFGERETLQWLADHPESGKMLLGMALLQIGALKLLKWTVLKKVSRELNLPQHPVFKQLEAFYDHSIRCFEKRVEKLGISRVPIHSISWFSKVLLLIRTPYYLIRDRIKFRTPLLTSTYLQDPVLLAEQMRSPLSRPKPE